VPPRSASLPGGVGGPSILSPGRAWGYLSITYSAIRTYDAQPQLSCCSHADMTLPPPLTIQTPLPGEHFGPGFSIRGGMGIGPLPTTDDWLITLRGGPVDNETEITTGLGSRNLNFNEIAWFANNIASLTPAQSSVVSGQNAELVVRLRRNTTEILEEVRVPIVPDWYSGTPFLLATRQTTAGGGFAESVSLGQRHRFGVSLLYSRTQGYFTVAGIFDCAE